MRHPSPQIQKNQDEFLENCPEEEREFHAALFRIGNAAYRYHQLSISLNMERLKLYFEEWLQGLPPSISEDMKRQGFERCQSMLPFTRYVNERNDIGMDEWMKEHLSEEDYSTYRKAAKK
ncbi:MAG: hypothetical protein H6Q13_2875 [Bacteroidetes bacterium]|nr:hypothetical protein [Bacteroidota bacterium]